MKKILFLLFSWFCFLQVHAGNKIFYLQGDAQQSKVIVTQGTSVSLNIPELCGIIQFGIIKGNESIWFKDAKNLKVKQDNRIITYTLKDKILENGEIIFRMEPMKNADGFLIEMSCINCPGNANLLWCYGGAYNKVIKNKEDCMLLPEYCKENIFSIERTSFCVYFGESMKFRTFQGITPLSSEIRLCDAHQQLNPLQYFKSGKKTDAQSLGAICKLDNQNKLYFAFYAPNRGTDYNYFMLSKLFNE